MCVLNFFLDDVTELGGGGELRPAVTSGANCTIGCLFSSKQTLDKSQATVRPFTPTQQESYMKQPKPSSKTRHTPPEPQNSKANPLHPQTEATPGRDQVRDATHSTRSPRESKRPIERTARANKRPAGV